MKEKNLYEVSIRGMCDHLRWVKSVEIHGGDIVIHTSPDRHHVSEDLATSIGDVFANAENRPRKWCICTSSVVEFGGSDDG